MLKVDGPASADGEGGMKIRHPEDLEGKSEA